VSLRPQATLGDLCTDCETVGPRTHCVLVDEASSTSFTRKIASPSALSYLVGADPRLANGAVPCLADRGTVSGKMDSPKIAIPTVQSRTVLYILVASVARWAGLSNTLIRTRPDQPLMRWSHAGRDWPTPPTFAPGLGPPLQNLH
jgi:hypothetical protein